MLPPLSFFLNGSAGGRWGVSGVGVVVGRYVGEERRGRAEYIY